MPMRVSCPFCNTAFDAAHGGRVSCPRCGESVPVPTADDSGLPQPSTNGDGVHAPTSVEDATPAPSGLKPLALLASAVFAAVAVAIGVWLGGFFRPKEPRPDTAKRPPNARATWPPQTLVGLRYLPADSQVVFAAQPSPLLQYAERTKQDANAVLADGGLPKPVFDWLTEAGIKPEDIDHVAVGVKFEGLVPPFAILLALRKPLADENAFLNRLKAKRNPDTNAYTIRIAALIADVSLVRVDETKYLFAYRDADLVAAKKPADGIAHFRKDLQESIRKLSPSAFLWLATDTQDWKANETLGFLAEVGMKQPDLWKRFDPKLRATAIGLSLETDLTVRASVRYLDNVTMAQRVKPWNEKLAPMKGQTEGAGEWATATVPLHPTDACGQALKLVYEP